MYSYDYDKLADVMEDLVEEDYDYAYREEVANSLHIYMRKKVTAEELSDIDSSDFNIDYYFPKTKRNNSTGKGYYGSDKMTQRRLFEILIAMNGGDDFIQRYFVENYPNRIKDEIDAYLTDSLQAVNSALQDMEQVIPLTKEGVPDKRYNITKEFEYIKTEKNKIYSLSKKEVAETIKQDIINCLQSGIIYLNKELSSATQEQRVRLGLNMEPAFYATGNFIKSIVIVFRYNKDAI